MKIKILLDMDGTIADLYNTPNWLEKIKGEKMGLFSNLLYTFNGHKIIKKLISLRERNLISDLAILTWLPMDASVRYECQVEREKIEWISKTPLINSYDDIICIPYGTPKENYTEAEYLNILIDDNEEIRQSFINSPVFGKHKNLAFDPKEVLEVLDLIELLNR